MYLLNPSRVRSLFPRERLVAKEVAFIPIRQWRVIETEGGAFCFFDPLVECICIRKLTRSEVDDRIKEYGSVSGSKTETEPVRQMHLNKLIKEHSDAL